MGFQTLSGFGTKIRQNLVKRQDWTLSVVDNIPQIGQRIPDHGVFPIWRRRVQRPHELGADIVVDIPRDPQSFFRYPTVIGRSAGLSMLHQLHEMHDHARIARRE